MPFDYEALRDRAQQTLVDFLNSELAIGSTFARSALNAYDAGHVDHYAAAKRRATEAADSVRHFMSGIVDEGIRNEIGNKLTEFDRLMSAL
jgi:hypothetical protein